MASIFINVAGAALAAAITCIALDTQSAQDRGQDAKKEQRPARQVELTELHKRLASEAGTWDAEVRAWPGPNVAPSVSKAVERTRVLGKGLWLISDLEGKVMGRPYHGHRVVGYDAKKKRFVGTWVNTMSAGIVQLEGKWDAKTKARTMWLTMRHPLTRKPCKAKLVTRYVDAKRRVVSLEAPLPQAKGKYFPVLEMRLKRRK